jgi:hypothetical protein
MEKAVFEILGLEYSLGKFQNYYDEGFVESLPESVVEICDRYKSGEEYKNFFMIQYSLNKFEGNVQHGVALTCKKRIGPFVFNNIHILYEDMKNECVNFFLRGHEETEALIKLGGLDLLIKEMEKEDLFFDVENSNREQIANAGAIYALRKKGYETKIIENEDGSYGFDFLKL